MPKRHVGAQRFDLLRGVLLLVVPGGQRPEFTRVLRVRREHVLCGRCRVGVQCVPE
jgi:hypothetical protein